MDDLFVIFFNMPTLWLFYHFLRQTIPGFYTLYRALFQHKIPCFLLHLMHSFDRVYYVFLVTEFDNAMTFFLKISTCYTITFISENIDIPWLYFNILYYDFFSTYYTMWFFLKNIDMLCYDFFYTFTFFVQLYYDTFIDFLFYHLIL